MEDKIKDLEERLRKAKDMLRESYDTMIELEYYGTNLHIKIEEFFYDENEEIPEPEPDPE